MIQLTHLTDSLISVEVPIDAFNIGIKLDTLHYDSKGQQTANIDLKGNYTILGEVQLKNGISCFTLKSGNEIRCNEYNRLFKNKGCILNSDNKFIILKRTNYD
jgi:hypothetical protein